LVIKAALEQTVKVELLPRTQIDVYVQVRASEQIDDGELLEWPFKHALGDVT
jgi:ribonuclease PH